jgi:hypothetical protein
MQPLDVAVFAPMKRRWRDILSVWKDECAAKGDNYATIPKQVQYRTYLPLLYTYVPVPGVNNVGMWRLMSFFFSFIGNRT